MTLSFVLHSAMQYNVTVVGVTKTGQRTKGSNMMQFTTPAPAVRLTTALSATRGTANATALPNGYFAKVHSMQGLHYRGTRLGMRMSGRVTLMHTNCHSVLVSPILLFSACSTSLR